MAVVNDYKCPKHGYFEARKPQCPMKDCHEEVMVVFLQAPNLISLTPQQAGVIKGPTIDPSSTMRDPDNLQIKR